MHNASLTISNPYILYRSLVATQRIRPDPAQTRLALHLSKLYDRLKDYEPTVEYSQRLQKLGRALGPPNQIQNRASRGLWQSLLKEKEKRDTLAMTKVLSDHEEALKLDSPRGLMVHGEVGTGKSMLIDLFAESLPTRKKRRWHFNTFMLDTFRKLEKLRISRLSRPRNLEEQAEQDDHSMLFLARDLIEKSPILFLDEFQLPDRASAKIMTNLMTGFFGLGGVLVATSNRMPDELAKAAGIEFVPPARRGRFGSGKKEVDRSSSRMFAGQGEFGMFWELLKARCDIWEMEGKSDYRRVGEKKLLDEKDISINTENVGLGKGISKEATKADLGLPAKYFIQPAMDGASLPPEFSHQLQVTTGHHPNAIPWAPSTLKVYGRNVPVPCSYNSVVLYTFTELCGSNLGPADYISLASSFHTIIITDIPILTSSLKNEARRFITLIDALYEAKCKLLVAAQADPDNLFFPELRPGTREVGEEKQGDAVYPETFSDIHQDLTAPFRPNVSLYSSDDKPNTTRSRFTGILAEDALEDDPPNRVKRMLGRTDSDFLEDEKFEVKRTLDFGQTGILTGEDEKFAYKRATSRLWEMCGRKWWDRVEEGWWRPLPVEARGWEKSAEQRFVQMLEGNSTLPLGSGEGMVREREVNEKEDEIMYRYSPFRTSVEEPPKIGWTHAWGMAKWGKKAGAWGQGVEGLKDRKKGDEK